MNAKDHATNSIYQQLIILMVRAKRQMFLVCDTYKLTPVQGMLMMVMAPGESRTMNELSNIMGCDASNITGLIDRLESQGLIERAADEHDRRVKKIRLSAKGVASRNEILEKLAEAEVLDLDKLSAAEKNTLRDIVAKLV